MQAVSIPKINGGAKSTRDAIISLLSSKWPLSAKEIYGRLAREHGFEGTYQAVHKAIAQALAEGVVVREGKGYSLSKEWIENVKNFGTELDSSYNENGTAIDYNNFEGSVHLRFGQFIEFITFIVYGFFMKFPNPEMKTGVCCMEHTYAILGAPSEGHEVLKEMFTSCEHYGLSRNNTFLDKWCADYLTKTGKKQQLTGVNYSMHTDTFVQGDFVMQAFLAPELKERMDRLYRKIKSSEDIDLKEYYEQILNFKTEINVLVTKNATLAEGFRKEVLEICRREGEK